MDVAINYWAVLVSGVAAVVLGMLWYGPLFGKLWMRETGVTPEAAAAYRADPKKMMAMNRNYATVALFGLVMAYVLAHILVYSTAYMHTDGLMAGLQGAFWVWLGFIVPCTLNSVLWEGRSKKYWLIVAGYYLVSLCLMGAILSLWT